jgi:hypothetical protein
VLYVLQGLTDEFSPGCEIDISLEPYDHAMRCTVRRLGDRFEPAPDSIARADGRFDPDNQIQADIRLCSIHQQHHSRFAAVGNDRVQQCRIVG